MTRIMRLEIFCPRRVKFLAGTASLVLVALLAGACVGAQSSGLDSGKQAGPLAVITTIPVLADLAGNVGGDLVEIRSVVPPGADVHSYQTTPAISVAINAAAVIISNGAGLDDFLLPVLMGAKTARSVSVVASGGLAGKSLEENLEDPHFWQDPLLAIHYVERIRDGLAMADPDNAPAYENQAQEYILRLKRLDQEISGVLSQVPVEYRRLVTYHQAFSHLGRRYNWKTHALVAGDGDAPTPSAILEVTQIIEDARLPAVFAEPQFPTSVLEAMAADAQASVAPIYAGLSSRHPSTYIDMMLFNARSMAENMRAPTGPAGGSH